MSDREQVRQARRHELDAKLRTQQGKQEVVAMWKAAIQPPRNAREDDPSFFRMIDEILDREFPPS